MTDRSPEAQIWDLLRGALATRALGTVADLRVADALAGGPRPVTELADELGAHPDTLHRVLRALASDGIFAEDEPGVFRNTDASELLRAEGTGAWREFAHLFGGVFYGATESLDAGTSRSTFAEAFGDDFWTWLAAHPDERAIFDRAMSGGKESSSERLGGLDWRGDETVVDVGGGNGALLQDLLGRVPGVGGVVFDLPETVRDENLGDRIDFVEGSFFDTVPAGDVYILSGILHDWDDDRAAAILRTIRAGARAEARLVILESVIGPGNDPDGAKWLDLLMLVLADGRERTEREWRTLLEGAGFVVDEVEDGLIQSAMPLTVGTAGHIDHGKTWLVRALTGKDTDRLPEERARGISIALGYAPLDLPDGRRLSLVDVPGHERFIRTMVAGATGIDLFLLVVDAAEGARPQTHEHLAILRLLGVERGVVAVTKADAVDDETLELALAEARELVPGAEVIAVSAKTGLGLDDLRAALARASEERERERDGAPARLYIDRVFTLHGIGTVATGTLWSGRIAAGDILGAAPRGRTVRIRSVHVHDEEVAAADAGQRVAVALPGVERTELRPGDVLVQPGAYNPSYRLDVELEEIAAVPPRAIVHHGTTATLARVARTGRFAQLRLDAPVVAAAGDRVVLRAGTTVGGGRVLDPAPPRHSDIERFERTVRGETLVHAPVRDDDGEWRYSDEWLDERRAELERGIDAADTLDPGVAAPTAPWADEVIQKLGLERRGAKLYRPGATGSLAGREAEAAALEGHLGLEPVKVDDPALARFLEDHGRLIRVGDGLAVSREAYEQARDALVAECSAAETISLARFRDLLGTSRRTAQLVLERFDTDGLTRRVGDQRVLRRAATRR